MNDDYTPIGETKDGKINFIGFIAIIIIGIWIIWMIYVFFSDDPDQSSHEELLDSKNKYDDNTYYPSDYYKYKEEEVFYRYSDGPYSGPYGSQ
jgi:hypothetical protein